MKTFVAALVLALTAGCAQSSSGSLPSSSSAGSAGQLKSVTYKCSQCGATNPAAVTCHGKPMMLIP